MFSDGRWVQPGNGPRRIGTRAVFAFVLPVIASLILFSAGSATGAPESAYPSGERVAPIFDITALPTIVSTLVPTLTPTNQPPAAIALSLPADQPALDASRIEFSLETSGCVPWEVCEGSAIITIKAFERMPGEQVERIYARVGTVENLYPGNSALIRVPETDERGFEVEYWAVSSFEETMSPRREMKARFVPLLDEEGSFRFDLIGSDWDGALPPGSLNWMVFPPIDDSLPKALDQPFSAEYLYTTNRYIYLAGYLISSGAVKAAECENNGLMVNGGASLCGEKAASQAVLDWQNQYDDRIYTAAIRENIPARVLKGIIAQETQFWPTSANPREVGLGMFTENGADLVLMWNIPYYLGVCQPIYGPISCSVGYASLDAPRQQVLRKAIIDVVGTDAEIDLLAATVHASANQIGQLIPNNTGFTADEAAEYIDLWKIATGNYYAGAGCVSRAINQISNQKLELTWEELVRQMDDNCKPAEKYVEKVFGASE